MNLEGRQVSSTRTRAHQEVHPEAGPVRLTRFVDMLLENYYASVSNMVSAGQFEHIGRATSRIEVDHVDNRASNTTKIQRGPPERHKKKENGSEREKNAKFLNPHP